MNLILVNENEFNFVAYKKNTSKLMADGIYDKVAKLSLVERYKLAVAFVHYPLQKPNKLKLQISL